MKRIIIIASCILAIIASACSDEPKVEITEVEVEDGSRKRTFCAR